MECEDGQDMISLTKAVLSGRGEASRTALAPAIVEQFRESDEDSKVAHLKALAERFGSDHQSIAQAAKRYLDDPLNAHALALHEAAEPHRQEPIRRLNRAPNGTAALVDMRKQLISLLRAHPELAELDVAQDRDRLLKIEDRQALTLADERDWHFNSESAVALEKVTMPLADYYFLRAKRADGALVDPVARFHLGNGARLESVNWLADVSTTGLTQAAGLIVNYLYDLQHIESNHEAFVNQGEVAASDGVKAWLEASSLNQSGRQLGKADADALRGVPGME